ncbi:MAG: GDP-mannose 4,6-dehydratase [Clostridiales bacterium]|nr:GDP-mannose 4,6-dehydratase [Clostridiales bacterium]
MKIAVTGGCGFIGSHTVDFLIEKGHDVVAYDNLSTGSLENLNTSAYFYQGEVEDRTQLDAFFIREKPDAVMHMAAQIDVQASMKNPSYDANVNIMGTVNILDMCKKYGVERFVYSSSAAIYGNPEYLGVDEKHPKNPESFYGYSKLVPETYIRMYCDSSDMNYGILRYANVYGPRQKAEGEGGVVAIFTDRMNKNKDCFIYGDGEQTRDFIYVKDIAAANAAALESTASFTANASTSSAVSVNALFNIMKLQYGYQKDVIYKPERPGDIIHSWLTNEIIKNELKWDPKYNLESGIKEMAAYYD